MKVGFVFHIHQPVGNFRHVMEAAFEECYRPMLDVLASHEGMKCGLHISGSLLEWLENNHPRYIEKVSELCRSGRMELLTGGRYEPVLTVFHGDDVRKQVEAFSDHLETISGARPAGLWLTERVWEPWLASVLADAGVRWVVVDDIHLERAGVGRMDMFRPCMTGDGRGTVRLLAGSMEMRYMVPFAPAGRVVEWLKKQRDAGVGLVFYGDDGEKFGVWPGTGELCYDRGWLHEFFGILESLGWLDIILPSRAAGMPAAGPFCVPAGSYREMNEWTVHPDHAEFYGRAKAALESAGLKDSAGHLLAGGTWRNFLVRYPESGELHGRVLASRDMVLKSGDASALEHYRKSQCNCAYWHGVFGGVYLPHLREALWREINLAERIALEKTNGFPGVEPVDTDCDGERETRIITRGMSLVVRTFRGLTVGQLAFFTPDGSPVVLGDVLSRRREAYHDEISDEGPTEGAIGTIHSNMGSKEEGLASGLIFDRWKRTCFTSLVMPADSGLTEWMSCGDTVKVLRGIPNGLSTTENGETLIFRGDFSMPGIVLRKEVSVSLEEPVLRLGAEWITTSYRRVGIEICLNLLAGNAPDRFYAVNGGRKHEMAASGVFRVSRLEVVDLYRKAAVVIEAESPCDLWVAPIESVNRSESGFERVYQGTAFLFSGVAEPGVSIAMKLTMSMRSPEEAE